MSTTRLLVAVALVFGTAAVAAVERRPVTRVADNLNIPYAIGSWEGEDAGPLDAETEESIAADQVINRTYLASGGGATGLYVAYYAQQRPGVSIHSPLHCLPGTGWNVLSTDTIAVDMNGKTGSMRRLIAQKGPERVLILYWYDIQRRMIASDIGSRMQLLSDRVWLGRNDAALVRLAVPVEDSDAEAEQRGLAFARALAPHL